MSFCTNCGKQTPDDAVVCPYCGNALGTGGGCANARARTGIDSGETDDQTQPW